MEAKLDEAIDSENWWINMRTGHWPPILIWWRSATYGNNRPDRTGTHCLLSAAIIRKETL